MLAFLEDDQLRAGRLQKRTVVAHQKQGASVGAFLAVLEQCLFESFGGGDVEVVAGFIEDQQVVR